MSFQELAVRTHGQWDELIPALSPDPHMEEAIKRGYRKHGPCPVHGGDNGDAFRSLRKLSRDRWCGLQHLWRVRQRVRAACLAPEMDVRTGRQGRRG